MSNSLNLMRARLNLRGGITQQDRMIKDKRETLDRVVLYSYQGADVRDIKKSDTFKALINPNQVKQDYDDKIISIGYESNFKPGTVFEWIGTKTKWLIYLQDLTELAYFKGDIRKCNYKIAMGNKSQTVYAAVRGPVETQITSSSSNSISYDIPNHSLSILMPQTKETLEYFTRYSKFYLKPLAEGAQAICWRVEATDTISMPGILQITAMEYYINEDEDDLSTGVVGGLVVEEIPQPSDDEIMGPVFIKPKLETVYTIAEGVQGEWEYNNKLPITSSIGKNGKEITLIWNKTYTGQFVLKYGDKEKTIVVESLF